MRFLITFVLSVLIFSSSYSQERKKNDMFNLDILNFFSPDSTKTRLDIYTEIPFNKVEFKRNDKSNDFETNIDLTVSIKDLLDNMVFYKVYKETITTPKTDLEYLSSNSQIIIKNIFLEPGDYKIRVSIYEPGTKKFSEKDENIKIRDFLKDPLTISNVMIVAKLNEVNGRKYITPDVSRNVNDLDTCYLFFFVYRNSESPSIKVNSTVKDSKNDQVFSDEQTIDITNGIDIQNRIFIPIPTSRLPLDKFKIEVIASSSDYTTSETSAFDNENVNFPVDLNKIDNAISQLQYIAKESELDYIKDGKTDAEKRKRFIEFWNSKDPTPSTRRNEVMNEYYKRINYANKHFSTPYTEGWRTDMGMVYIIFGLPNNIDRHPYEMGSKPYEIWDYYDINRQFVFVDDSGFGDYRLITPIWDRFNYRFNQ